MLSEFQSTLHSVRVPVILILTTISNILAIRLFFSPHFFHLLHQHPLNLIVYYYLHSAFTF